MSNDKRGLLLGSEGYIGNRLRLHPTFAGYDRVDLCWYTPKPEPEVMLRDYGFLPKDFGIFGIY